MVIQGTTGNIGIGTTTPEATLHVSKETEQAQLLLENTDSSAGSQYPSVFTRAYNGTAGGHGAIIGERAAGTKDSPSVLAGDLTLQAMVGRAHDGTDFKEVGRVGIISGDNFAADQIDGKIIFDVKNNNANVRAMVIMGDGNIGIGTASPEQKLSVVGIVESTSGGYKFPDGTIQVTAAVAVADIKSNGRFVATQNRYAASDSTGTPANDACILEFGAGYRVADWNDIVSFYNQSSEARVKEFYVNINLKPYHSLGQVAYLISKDSLEIHSGTRHYFLSRHDHDKPGNYLSHATINANELDVGSWSGTRNALCYKQ